MLRRVFTMGLAPCEFDSRSVYPLTFTDASSLQAFFKFIIAAAYDCKTYCNRFSTSHVFNAHVRKTRCAEENNLSTKQSNQ